MPGLPVACCLGCHVSFNSTSVVNCINRIVNIIKRFLSQAEHKMYHYYPVKTEVNLDDI